MDEIVAVQGVEAHGIRQEQLRLDFQAAVDVDILRAHGQIGCMNFGFQFGIMGSLLRFGFMRGLPIYQAFAGISSHCERSTLQ